jgi:transposase
MSKRLKGSRKRRKRRSPPTFRADVQSRKERRAVFRLTGRRRRKFLQTLRSTKDADTRRRYLIVWHWTEGFSKGAIATMVGCHRNTVARVLSSFEALGELGLMDGRVRNGPCKVTPSYEARVEELIAGQPEACWNHSTWTQELLIRVLGEETGIWISVSTMSRVLRRLRARKGRPKPVVGCPWPTWKRQRRLRQLRRLVETCPPDELVLWEDEVDIHLNPKIGPDWMLPGQQKVVVTPGKNQKRYVAGAMTRWNGTLVWVEGPSKCSLLFIQLVKKLVETFSPYRVIHLIVDNYIIHTSKITQKAMAALKGAVQLHFLPPYCPSANRIERLWKDLHARVTRNHRCPNIESLIANVQTFLEDPWTTQQQAVAMAA